MYETCRSAERPSEATHASAATGRQPAWGRCEHGYESGWEAVRSSISLPLIFTPHQIQGRLFVDGCILCSDISKCIPADDHARTLFILTTRSIPSRSFSDVIISGVSSRAAYDTQKKYPDRTCLIVDDDTPTLDMWSTPEGIHETVDAGRAAMREFLTHAAATVLGPSASIKNCSKVAVLGGPE